MVGYQLEIPGYVVRSMQSDAFVVHVCAETQSKSATCPSCGVDSKRVHSYYERMLLDLPLGEKSVKICVRVKRFHYQQVTCKRHTFAETLADLAERYARRTQRVARIV